MKKRIDFLGETSMDSNSVCMLGYALAKENFRLNISRVVSLYVDEGSRKKRTYVMTG